MQDAAWMHKQANQQTNRHENHKINIEQAGKLHAPAGKYSLKLASYDTTSIQPGAYGGAHKLLLQL